MSRAVTTRDLWEAFAHGGVMVHCIRYGGPDGRCGGVFREPVEGEVIACPQNVRLLPIPAVFAVSPVSPGSNLSQVAQQNAAVADRVLREVVQRTGLMFRFSGDRVQRAFVFDGRNPTVLVEPDESVELDGMPVTVLLSALNC